MQGITTLAIVNTGGQTKDHGSNNTAGDTLVSYRLGAYETESPGAPLRLRARAAYSFVLSLY